MDHTFVVGDEVQYVGQALPEIRHDKRADVVGVSEAMVRVRFHDGYTFNGSHRNFVLSNKYRDEELRSAEPSLADTNPKTLVGRLKVDMALLPPASKIHEAHAFMDGADKYGPYNWREKKVSVMVYLGAMMRHIDAFLDGEDEAPDSGVHHLGHAKACAGIILDAQATGNLIDDRPVKGVAESLQAVIHRKMKERASAKSEA